MEIQVGYVYHIKDSYFTKTGDSFLSINKEFGHSRPTLICMQDDNPALYWAVPISSQIEKYKERIDRSKERYGECLTVVAGKWNGNPAAFLTGNMFPVTDKYIDHLHLAGNKPVRVHYKILDNIIPKVQKILRIHAAGKRVAAVDLNRLAKIMLDELAVEQKSLMPPSSPSSSLVTPTTSDISFTIDELNALKSVLQDSLRDEMQRCDQAKKYRLSGLIKSTNNTLTLLDSMFSKVDTALEHGLLSVEPPLKAADSMTARLAAAAVMANNRKASSPKDERGR